MEKIIAAVGVWCAGVIAALGYPGIVMLMALESACLPLPSELVMPFAGYLVSTGQFTLAGAATAGAIGCNLGSIVGYELGRHGGRPLVARYGKYLLIGTDDLARAERFFGKHGSWAVLVGRLLPVVRTYIAFPAGVARMPLGRFHLFTFLGSWPWCYALAWIGLKLGRAWNTDPRLKQVLHSFDVVIVLAVLAAAGWFVWHKMRKAPA